MGSCWECVSEMIRWVDGPVTFSAWDLQIVSPVAQWVFCSLTQQALTCTESNSSVLAPGILVSGSMWNVPQDLVNFCEGQQSVLVKSIYSLVELWKHRIPLNALSCVASSAAPRASGSCWAFLETVWHWQLHPSKSVQLSAAPSWGCQQAEVQEFTFSWPFCIQVSC